MLHGRHGCEIHISDRETSVYPIQACLGLWLALLGPLASPNSTDQGIIFIYNIILYYQPLCKNNKTQYAMIYSDNTVPETILCNTYT